MASLPGRSTQAGPSRVGSATGHRLGQKRQPRSGQAPLAVTAAHGSRARYRPFQRAARAGVGESAPGRLSPKTSYASGSIVCSRQMGEGFVAEVVVRDETMAGRAIGEWVLPDLPDQITARELVRLRVRE